MLLLFAAGCAALVHAHVGSTITPTDPPQGNVNLQIDAGFSPVEAGELVDNLSLGFGLSGRSRVDDLGQMNDVGVHLFVVGNTEHSLRPFARSTLFAVAQYDVKEELQAPGIGARLEGGLLFCPGEDEGFYCAVAQLNGEYDHWFGGTRSGFWLGGSLGIALNWNEEL